MSDECLAQNDAKVALLEEAILKCEVQLQKAKRQCDALPAAAVAAHYDKHPQIQMFELQRLAREKEHLLEEKRQLRDEKLLLLMSKVHAPVGSAKHPRHEATLRVDVPGVFSWNLVTPLLKRRMGPAAAALRVASDTHVIITGGYNGDVGENVSNCEALLSDGRPSPLHIGDMLVARAWHCAVACGGCLYVMGGADNSQRYLCSTERCNMQDGQWSPCAPMSNTRYGFAAVALNGFIYCIGGYDGETWLDSVERYSPDSDSWEHVASMCVAREGCCAAVVGNSIFVMGGQNGDDGYLRSCERYDASTDTWHRIENLNGRRAWAGAAAVGGRIIVAGGTRSSNATVATDTVEAFSVTGATGWTLLPPLNKRRGWIAVAAVEADELDGSAARVFAVGGFDCQTSLRVAEVLLIP